MSPSAPDDACRPGPLGRLQLWFAAAGALLAVAGCPAQPETAPEPSAPRATAVSPAPVRTSTGSIARDGLIVQFSAHPADAPQAGASIRSGEMMRVQFGIRDAASDKGLTGLRPGAWLDLNRRPMDARRSGMSCDDKARLFLTGQVGFQPQVDINRYFVLVLNADATISVIDPVLGMGGITKLYDLIELDAPAAAWINRRHDSALYVSQPSVGRIAVIDTERFEVKARIDVGTRPYVLALENNGRFLWVGDDEGGVAVVDTVTRSVIAQIATGRGHHEIELAPDGQRAFVTNRDDGTLSIVDATRLEVLHQIEVGATPVSVAHSDRAQAIYVADGASGRITAIDAATGAVTARLAGRPGITSLKFAPGGRWALALNTRTDEAIIIDASVPRITHRVPAGKRPFELAFSRSYAYVRSLDTARVAMIALNGLGSDHALPVQYFAAGEGMGEQPGGLNRGPTIVPAADDAAVLVVNPEDSNVYYYMEGMVAPMGSFRNYGHRPRAVGIADRALEDLGSGLYSRVLRAPPPGSYDAIFLLDSPSIVHCFEMHVGASVGAPQTQPVAVEFEAHPGQRVGRGRFELRFSLRRGASPVDTNDVRVRHFVAPGHRRREVAAEFLGNGRYRAALEIVDRGAHYIHVATASGQVSFGDLPFLTVVSSPSTGEETP